MIVHSCNGTTTKNFKCTIFWDVTPCSSVEYHRNHYGNFRSKKELGNQSVVSTADKPAGQFLFIELDATRLLMEGMWHESGEEECM
jgi:hypothetical protein